MQHSMTHIVTGTMCVIAATMVGWPFNVCHRGNDGGMALVVLWDGKFCTEGG